MSEQRIASRYARPLLEIALEKGCLEEVMKDMMNFKSLCETNKDFVLMLRNPIIPHLKKLTVLKEIFSKKMHELTLATFDLITKKSRENYLPEIANEFAKRYNTYKGIAEATVTTVIPLSDSLRKDVISIVKNITKQESVELTQIIDKDILGGFILTIDDQQIDDSISGKLNELKLKFNQNL